MKKNKQILMILFALTMIISCEKNPIVSQDTLSVEKISAKWVIDGISIYKSFEFNKSGNYIVVKKASTDSTSKQFVLFGTYEITDKKTLVLSDFGKIKISEISDKSLSFSVSLITSPNIEVAITASKNAEIQSTTKTDLLCRTWEMVTINGKNVVGTDNDLSVLFSASGTYFVSFANPTDENHGGLAQWKWKDDSQTNILYSWDEVPVWNKSEFVEISKLTSDSLKILEKEDTYVLKPKSNLKSNLKQGMKSIPTSTSRKSIKTGFFKR
jgi:hypothetical protein